MKKLFVAGCLAASIVGANSASAAPANNWSITAYANNEQTTTYWEVHNPSSTAKTEKLALRVRCDGVLVLQVFNPISTPPPPYIPVVWTADIAPEVETCVGTLEDARRRTVLATTVLDV